MPIRMTPAQMVGAQFAQALVMAHGEEQMEIAAVGIEPSPTIRKSKGRACAW
jgi:hypothetical protein